MEKYKYKRRIRKIKRFGKKLSTAIIFLIASYLLSLFSFFLYTKLSEILLPENKGFLGFAIIGLVAGFIAVLVSFINKRLILTVVISFFIDCLVESIFLYSKLGIQVIQFLPGLLVSMSTVIASWYFLKTKLGLVEKNVKTLHNTREQVGNKYALARKLIENPNKITLEVFKEACALLRGIDPKIDAVLKEADRVFRTLTFLDGGEAIGFVVSHIKVKTEKDEEKKEKLLFFIDLVNDIREEVNVALVKINAAKAEEEYIGHQNTAANTIAAASGPSGLATIGATIVATTVVVANAAGIIPGIPLLPKNEFRIPVIQDSQETNIPGGAESTALTATPTVAPILAASAITIDNGWGHFTRIFNGPPGSNIGSTLDPTTIAVYASIHNTGTAPDRLTGAVSEFCKNFTMQDMSPDAPDGGLLSSISIPAESTVELKFMGQRLICEGASGVNQGDHIPVGLIFEKFGQVQVLIEIRATPN